MRLKVTLERPTHMASLLAHGKRLVFTNGRLVSLNVQDLQCTDLKYQPSQSPLLTSKHCINSYVYAKMTFFFT
jgi:hypothetical protein